MAELSPWAAGYVAAWAEAGAGCAGRAASADNPHARAAYWEAYTELTKQGDEAQGTLSAQPVDQETT